MPGDQQSEGYRLIPTDEVRRILGQIGRTKTYELIASGDLRAVKLGRRTLFVEAEVKAFAARLPRKPMRKRRTSPTTDLGRLPLK